MTKKGSKTYPLAQNGWHIERVVHDGGEVVYNIINPRGEWDNWANNLADAEWFIKTEAKTVYFCHNCRARLILGKFVVLNGTTKSKCCSSLVRDSK